jgi:hypothetical protein
LSTISTIRTNRHFEFAFGQLARELLMTPPVDRGGAHAQKTDDPNMLAYELYHVSQYFEVPVHMGAWEAMIKPNLPWAEDHFQERISGEPLNPPPSEQYWPFAQQGNAAHKEDEKFSHTYPERFYPKHAEQICDVKGRCTIEEHVSGRRGIRFTYGDLSDLIEILVKDRMSRQAYLPVWFPEDLTAAREGKRVPCTLGYHFMVDRQNTLRTLYPMRSCDLVRFFRDDVYMAGRLAQHVAECIGVELGEMTVMIANLHAFVGDGVFLNETMANANMTHTRIGYNLDALS